MFKIKYLGLSQEPVVIIDNFYPNFDDLKKAAVKCDFAKHAEFYPGVQAGANPSHLQPVAPLLTQIFKDAFGIQQGVSLVQCAYSIVTTADADLSPIQRLPHVDTTDVGRIALLHYLSGAEQGGTAFYRHRKTGLEVLSPDTYETYRTALEAEGLPKAGYMRGSDERFKMIEDVAAKPNRAILYRSAFLHSGYIPEYIDLSSDPAKGRLTLNSFFQAKSVAR